MVHQPPVVEPTQRRTGWPVPATAPPDAPAPGAVGRRRFLTWLVAAPTLTMAVQLGRDLADPEIAAADPIGLGGFVDFGDLLYAINLPTALDMVIEVTAENRVVAALTRLESGQSITTMVAMLLAEEMGARLVDIDVRLADADPLEVLMFTGGSNTARVLYEPTRRAAAAMRARLVTAAAQEWGVAADTLTVRETAVWAPDGRHATFAALASAAARVLIPAVSAEPKPSSQFTVIGRPTGRIEATRLVQGGAKYTADLDVPGALPTVVAHAPTIGGTVAQLDDTAARSMPGVVGVTPLPTGVAVTARTFHEAFAARDTLQITWNPGPAAGLSDDDIRTTLRQATLPFVAPPVLGLALDATFDFAYLSHSPMEVQTAVADVRPDAAEVWFPSQAPIDAQNKIAAALGLLAPPVTVHVVPAGGSFGRRLYHEPAIEAVLVSQALGRPVKLMWSRADDMKHGRFRPASHHKVRAVTLLGNVLTYEHRVAAPELEFDHGLGDAATAAGFELPPTRAGLMQSIFQVTQQTPYHLGVVTELLTEVPVPIPNATWRSVFSGTVVVVNEIMIDEIARRLNRDPVQFRRQKISSARLRAVLEKVVAEGAWGRALPAGHAQGVAVHEEYKSCVAYLVELDATGAEPRVTRVVVAADVGRCINPRAVEAQLQGCAIDAISTIFWAGNHIDDGAVRESSFSDFRYARMRDAPPRVDVHLIQGADQIGGVGELGYPAAAAAVANAYARATGTKPRSFPIFHQGA